MACSTFCTREFSTNVVIGSPSIPQVTESNIGGESEDFCRCAWPGRRVISVEFRTDKHHEIGTLAGRKTQPKLSLGL